VFLTAGSDPLSDTIDDQHLIAAATDDRVDAGTQVLGSNLSNDGPCIKSQGHPDNDVAALCGKIVVAPDRLP